MTRIEELTQKLAEFNRSPLPPHFAPLLKAICEGHPTDVLATLIYRWNNWPHLLLKLARLHQLSDAEVETLRDIYLAKGDDFDFQTAFSKLAMHKQGKDASNLIPKVLDLPAGRAKVATSHQLSTIFEEFLMEERARLGKGPDWPDEKTVAALKKDFQANHLSLQDLRSRLKNIPSNKC